MGHWNKFGGTDIDQLEGLLGQIEGRYGEHARELAASGIPCPLDNNGDIPDTMDSAVMVLWVSPGMGVNGGLPIPFHIPVTDELPDDAVIGDMHYIWDGEHLELCTCIDEDDGIWLRNTDEAIKL